MELIEAIGYRSIKDLLDAGNLAGAGIRENDRSKRNAGLLGIALWLGLRVLLWFLIGMICKKLHFHIDLGLALLVVYSVAVWGYYRVVGQNTGADTKTTAPDDVDVEMARQEAERIDDDMCCAVYEAVCEVAKDTKIITPSDPRSIQTSDMAHLTMDGTMAIFAYELTIKEALNDDQVADIWHDLDRAIGRRSKGFKSVLVDGHAPMIFQLHNLGRMLRLEVVQYTNNEQNAEKIRTQQMVNIRRQNRYRNEADTYDRTL